MFNNLNQVYAIAETGCLRTLNVWIDAFRRIRRVFIPPAQFRRAVLNVTYVEIVKLFETYNL